MIYLQADGRVAHPSFLCLGGDFRHRQPDHPYCSLRTNGSGYSYDSDGNLLGDGLNSHTYNVYGPPATRVPHAKLVSTAVSFGHNI